MTARTRLADLMAQASPHLPLALSAALQAEHMAVCQAMDALRGQAAGDDLLLQYASTIQANAELGTLVCELRVEVAALREALEWARFRILAASSAEAMKDPTLVAGLARIDAALERQP
jgi:hypothetical protein